MVAEGTKLKSSGGGAVEGSSVELMSIWVKPEYTFAA